MVYHIVLFFCLFNRFGIVTPRTAQNQKTSPKTKNAKFTSNGGPIDAASALIDQANRLPPNVGANALANAVEVIAIPFTEPAMFGVTELLMRREVAEKQQLVQIRWGMSSNIRTTHK